MDFPEMREGESYEVWSVLGYSEIHYAATVRP
jgi:hypothetical protein